jgi:rare lipoprotein A (peptidoglycan hydrolase)
VGKPGQHRQNATPNTFRITVIVVTGIAAVALGAIAVATTGTGTSSARTSSQAAAYRSRVPDPPRVPGRAGRGASRTPLATPSPEPTETPPLQEAQVVQKKRHHRKILSRGACEASYYGTGGRTASGEAYDPDALTAAHRTLPLGSRVRVVNRNNDRSVIVRINDRGPFVAGRCLDLSSAAMHAVGGVASGVIPVRYEVLAA